MQTGLSVHTGIKQSVRFELSSSACSLIYYLNWTKMTLKEIFSVCLWEACLCKIIWGEGRWRSPTGSSGWPVGIIWKVVYNTTSEITISVEVHLSLIILRWDSYSQEMVFVLTIQASGVSVYFVVCSASGDRKWAPSLEWPPLSLSYLYLSPLREYCYYVVLISNKLKTETLDASISKELPSWRSPSQIFLVVMLKAH